METLALRRYDRYPNIYFVIIYFESTHMMGHDAGLPRHEKANFHQNDPA